MEFEIRKNYRNEEALRKSFNELAGKVFGLDFEAWYQNGFWGEDYVPYSMVKNGKVIANVSVNPLTFQTVNGEKRLVQLGTVMTDPEYRGLGLSRRLIEEIHRDYAETADGFYLFANESVLDFYPKFGYRKAVEYQAVKVFSAETDAAGTVSAGKAAAEACADETAAAQTASAKKVPMETKEDWDAFVRMLSTCTVNSSLEMKGNSGLIMFYLSSFLKDNVYYIEENDCYAVAEIDGDTLELSAVFADHEVDPETVAAAFGSEIRQVRLGFSPIRKAGWELQQLMDDDTTLFVQGEAFADDRLPDGMFPVLTHA
ncbi:MAG: GNAT family N-acetyltransferase [Lachnospiraceae bacterium]|nr:GNAT family N-acetyltransferase [Lachnospiraceae bacterium]